VGQEHQEEKAIDPIVSGCAVIQDLSTDHLGRHPGAPEDAADARAMGLTSFLAYLARTSISAFTQSFSGDPGRSARSSQIR
jgi:hypothetical protein